MRVCPKCGDYYSDQLLGFCLADGTPLVAIEPSSDLWDEGTRLIEQKQNALKTQQRRLKWRRVMLRAMLMTTMAVSVAAVNSSISVTVDQPRSELCIGTFNDLNGNGVQDASEPGLSAFVFQVSGTGPAITLTTDRDGVGCAVLPVGRYTVVETAKPGWTATTTATQTITVAANRAVNLFFGNTKNVNSDSACAEADRSREQEIIIGRFDASWRRMIEEERGGVIREAGIERGNAVLSEIKHKIVLDRRCATASVMLSYEWVVHSPAAQKKVIPKERRLACTKAQGAWDCRQSHP